MSDVANLTHGHALLVDEHIAIEQLIAIHLAHEVDAVYPSLRGLLHALMLIFIIFSGIGGQRREQLVAQQGGSIDIDVEEVLQAAISFPSTAGCARKAAHLLIVDIGSGVVQVAVLLYHIVAHPLLQMEHVGQVAQQHVLAIYVQVALHIEAGLILAHGISIVWSQISNLLHQRVGSIPLLSCLQRGGAE